MQDGSETNKKRAMITLNWSLYNKAKEVMDHLHFDNFSGFVEQLLREEIQRRGGLTNVMGQLQETADSPPPPKQPPSKSTKKYPAIKRKPKSDSNNSQQP